MDNPVDVLTRARDRDPAGFGEDDCRAVGKRGEAMRDDRLSGVLAKTRLRRQKVSLMRGRSRAVAHATVTGKRAATIAQLVEPWVAGSNPARGSSELTLPVSNAALSASRNRTLVVLRETRRPPVRSHQSGGASLIRNTKRKTAAVRTAARPGVPACLSGQRGSARSNSRRCFGGNDGTD